MMNGSLHLFTHRCASSQFNPLMHTKKISIFKEEFRFPSFHHQKFDDETEHDSIALVQIQLESF